jgi:hypothetical protein
VPGKVHNNPLFPVYEKPPYTSLVIACPGTEDKPTASGVPLDESSARRSGRYLREPQGLHLTSLSAVDGTEVAMTSGKGASGVAVQLVQAFRFSEPVFDARMQT